jgi:hypothetical protein
MVRIICVSGIKGIMGIHRTDLDWFASNEDCRSLIHIRECVFDRHYKDTLVDDKGVMKLGKRSPQIPGEEAWFHTLYPGLSELERDELDRDLGASLWNPSGVFAEFDGEWAKDTDYHELLSKLNGGRFFAGHFNLFGVRRGDPWRTAQPLELSSVNPFRSIDSTLGNVLVFGGYKWDGSLVLCVEQSGKVLRCARDGEILNNWEGVESFFSDEFDRLNRIFDDSFNLLSTMESSLP